MHEQRQRQHADEQPAGGIEQSQKLGDRVADADLRAGRQPEVFAQRWRVAGGEAGAVDDEHALPGGDVAAQRRAACCSAQCAIRPSSAVKTASGNRCRASQ